MRKRLFLFVGLITAIYSFSAFALYLMQDGLIYLPRQSVANDQFEQRWIPSADVEVRVWVLPGHDPDKAIIYFGGNSEDVTRNIKDFQQRLPGYTIYLMTYRGFGGAPGQPGQAAFQQDALAVFDHVAAEHARVIAMGRSLGTGVATYLASERDVEALILITPYDSLLALAQAQYPWYPIEWLMRDTYRSDLLASRISVPQLLILAGQDRVIPSEHSLRLAERLPKEGQSVLKIASAHHNNVSYQPGYWEGVQRFLESL